MNEAFSKYKPFGLFLVSVFCLGLGLWTATSFVQWASSQDSASGQPPSAALPQTETKAQGGTPQNTTATGGSGMELGGESPQNPSIPQGAGSQGDAVPGEAANLPTENDSLGADLRDQLGSLFITPYLYDSEDRRDPFKRYIEGPREGTLEIGLKEVVTVPPLQRFSLSQLKLVGIMWDVEEPKAMFTTGREMHLIGRDERIGRNGGYVAAIREGEVVIIEPVTVEGQVTYSAQVMKIER